MKPRHSQYLITRTPKSLLLVKHRLHYTEIGTFLFFLKVIVMRYLFLIDEFFGLNEGEQVMETFGRSFGIKVVRATDLAYAKRLAS